MPLDHLLARLRRNGSAPRSKQEPRPVVAPRNELETKLAAVWSECLQAESISVEDGFVELGGDSTLALQVAVSARREGLELTPQLIFKHRTIAALAKALAEGTPG